MAGNDRLNKRKRGVTNYVVLHKKGFSSTKIGRVKKVVGSKWVASSAPSSPSSVKLKKPKKKQKSKHMDAFLKEVAQGLEELNNANVGHVGVKGKQSGSRGVVNSSSQDNTDAQKGSETGIEKDTCQDLFVDLDSMVSGMSREERLRTLRADIAALEAQLVEEEEDEEMKLLLDKQKKLQQLVAKKKKAQSKTNSDIDCLKNRNENSDDDVFVNNFEEVTKNKLPSLNQIQNLLYVPEKKSRSKRLRIPRPKSSHRRQQSSSSSESFTSALDTEFSDVDSDNNASEERKVGDIPVACM